MTICNSVLLTIALFMDLKFSGTMPDLRRAAFGGGEKKIVLQLNKTC